MVEASPSAEFDMGHDFDHAIADAGGGQYYKNPSSSDIDDLFDLVTREFATIQTHGATIPLPPADYLRIEPGADVVVVFKATSCVVYGG